MKASHRTLLQIALDALEPISAFGRVGTKDVEQAKLQQAIAALREALAEPGPEPVAYLVEGWHDGKLIAHIPHLTLEDAKASAAVFSQHYTTTKLVPLYAAPPAAPAPAAPVPDGWVPVPREPLTDDLIDSVIRDVAELDYSSPEGMPDVMLVTADELRGILQARLCEALAAPPAATAVPLTQLLWCPETGELCSKCAKTGTCEASMLQAHGIGGGNG